jgi:RND family efflux transporter MFP subunit
MKKRRWYLIPLFAGVALAAAVLLFFVFTGDRVPPGRTGPGAEPPERGTKTVEARIEAITEFHDAVGTVKPRAEARIEAQVSGQVTSVRVHAGSRIERGDLLVLLDDRSMRARLSQARQALHTAEAQKLQARQAVASAEAALTESESAYRRIERFFEAEAATEQELEQARSRYLQSRAGLGRAEEGLSAAQAGERRAREMVQEAKVALGHTRVQAPADGEVIERLVDPGDLAMPGKPLLLLRTSAELRLEAHVRESLIPKVHPGARLQVNLTTLGVTVASTVEEIIPYADPHTRTFLVKSRLPETPGLYPGMYGKLRIPFRQIRIVLVPRAAVYEVGQLRFVRIRTPEGWQRRYIKTGDLYEDAVEVLSGLSGGEVLAVKEPGDEQ